MKLAKSASLLGAVALISAGCVQVSPTSSARPQTPSASSPAVSALPAPSAALPSPDGHPSRSAPSSPLSSSSSSGSGSLVFIVGFDVWLSAPDGSAARPLTSDGTDIENYHDPSQADDGSIWVVKGGSALYHLVRDGQPLAPPVTLPTLEHGAEGVAVSPDDRYIAYTTVGTGQYIDARFGTPTGTFLYGGTDIANPDGSSLPGAVMPSLLYPSWAGPTSLILSDGVDLYFDSVNSNPVQRVKWLSEQEGCLTDFDCPPGQEAAASLSNPAVSDDGSVVVYGYVPYYGAGGRRMSTAHGGVPGEPQTRCTIASPTQYNDNGSLNADGSTYYYDDTAFDPTTFDTTIGQGIWSLDVDLDADDCGASDATLIVPNASQPDWGPTAP